MAVENKQIEIDIESFSDEQFNIASSIDEAKKIINELDFRWITGAFEDDYWNIARLDYDSLSTSFDFSKLNSTMFSDTLPKEFKSMVKCWIIQLLQKYKVVANSAFTYLVKAFEESKGFRVNEKDNLIKFIEYSDYNPKTKNDIINAVCNFFDFADIEISEVYVPSLVELKRKIPTKNSIRRLPPSSDILSFSYFLEKHFESLLEDSINKSEAKKEILFIYPLVIWWRLTNLIPIRPTEFCLIERNCIHVEDKNFYIKLPRRKINSKKIQILDKILIDNDMHQLISHYKKLTDQMGITDTLVSYKSLIFADPSTNRASRKKNTKQFSIHALDSLIKRFYLVMFTVYDCNISKENQIRPNDTRHLAFVSLMMQGYSPVEIARLGGHQTISAQYHYSGHTEFWVDCEVYKLMTKTKQARNDTNNFGTIPREIKLKAYGPEGEYKKRLKIGYCKDKEQRCETRQCFFCSHWGITPEEFIKKEEKIKQIILSRKEKINELTAVISTLNRQLMNDEFNKRDSSLLTKLKTNTNAVQHEIRSLAKLCTLLGEGAVLNGEKISWS